MRLCALVADLEVACNENDRTAANETYQKFHEEIARCVDSVPALIQKLYEKRSAWLAFAVNRCKMMQLLQNSVVKNDIRCIVFHFSGTVEKSVEVFLLIFFFVLRPTGTIGDQDSHD